MQLGLGMAQASLNGTSYLKPGSVVLDMSSEPGLILASGIQGAWDDGGVGRFVVRRSPPLHDLPRRCAAWAPVTWLGWCPGLLVWGSSSRGGAVVWVFYWGDLIKWRDSSPGLMFLGRSLSCCGGP